MAKGREWLDLEFGCMMLGVLDNLKLSILRHGCWLQFYVLVWMVLVVIVGGIIEFTASCVGPVLTATFPIY